MTRKTSSILFATAALVLVAALAPTGCALEGTGGQRVLIELAFVGGAAHGGPLERGSTLYDPPFEIELEEAKLVVGAVYVFPPSTLARRWSAPFMSRAYAHAGDDNLFAVNALAEHRQSVVVDALSTTPTVIGPILAESGPADVVTVWIDAPRGALGGPEGPTRGHHGWVRGVARQGEREVRFEGGIALEDTPLSQRVDRIPLGAGAEVRAGSRVTVEVLAHQWLEQVDFASLLDDGDLEPDADGVARPAVPHAFQRAWLIGFHDPDAFRARVTGGVE